MCDRTVWLRLLNQTAEFSEEKLEELFNFVLDKRRAITQIRRAELMPEVVRVAANKFPSSHPHDRRGSPPKIIWTVEGWGTSETLEANNLERLKDVATAVRINFTILEVQELDIRSRIGINNLKMIADHVKQQGVKLASFEMYETRCHLAAFNETFLSLCKMSIRWKVQRLTVQTMTMSGYGWLKLDDLAGGSLDNGHIGHLAVCKTGEQVNLNALKRVWEIADEMLYIHDWLAGDRIQGPGGRGEEREAVWQRVIDFFFLHDNNDD